MSYRCMCNHRYYTNNTGLEASFCALALIVATEVINLKVASCTSYGAISVAVFDTSSRSCKLH